MTEDEKFVREQWEEVRTEHIGIWIKTGDRWERFSTVPRGAEFTRRRLEEIRQVEEEIRFVQIELGHVGQSCGEESCGCDEPFKRILAREQAALSDLRKGMKN